MKTSHTNRIASLKNLISGLEAEQPHGTFAIAGARYTTSELVALLQRTVDALEAVPLARGAYLKTSRAAEAQVNASAMVARDLKLALQMQAHDDYASLSRYGLFPRRTGGPQTPEVKVASAEKAKATRAARHTMGKRQKAKITGETAAAAALAALALPSVPR